MSIRSRLLGMLLGVSALFNPALAAEVTLPYKGLNLNADLTLAPGKTLADGVILITHGSLAHRDMEMLVAIRNLLRDKAYNTLAINLSLGVNNRHGMYDCKTTHRHLNDDAPHEIGAWVEWLKKKGAPRIAVLGHSRGGAQTALYAAEHDNPLLKAVILIAPAIQQNTSAATYQERYRKPIAPLLAKARTLVKQGKGDSVLARANLLTCSNTPVTAASFVSYYGQDQRHHTPYLLPKITKPTLVVAGGNDEVVAGLDKKVAPLADGKRIQLKVVDGADHFFRDLYAEDAVDAINAFLKDQGF